jgi:hypothetical protein
MGMLRKLLKQDVFWHAGGLSGQIVPRGTIYSWDGQVEVDRFRGLHKCGK